LGKISKEKCKDGSSRNVYKNPHDAFPLEIKNFKANIKGEIDALKGLKASGGADIQSLVVGLLCQIDEVNRSMQLQFSAVYVSYSANPCESDKWLRKEVSKIIQQEALMRERLAKIRGELAVTNDVKGTLTNGTMDDNQKREKIVENEFQQAMNNSEEWKQK
jgi:hypothetical protein